MPASQAHQEYIARNAYVETDGATWHLVLSDATVINETTTVTAALATEIVPPDGYITPAITFSGVNWDASTQKALAYAPDYEYVNAGTQTIQYQTQFLVCVPAGHTRRTPKNITQSSISGAANTITIPNHGYTAGDIIVIRVVSGSLDSALSAGVEYEVINTTTSTLQLTLDGVNVIDLQGNSSLLQAYVIDRTVDDRGYIYYTYPYATSIGANQSATIKFIVGCDTLI